MKFAKIDVLNDFKRDEQEELGTELTTSFHFFLVSFKFY